MKHTTDHEEGLKHSRLVSELKTIRAMLFIYCRAHHGPEKPLCQKCGRLLEYTGRRLVRCPFQADKPTCGKCRIHCYQPDMRESVRDVMRFAGPRMLLRHPLMALRHLLDGRRKPPEVPYRKRKPETFEPALETSREKRSTP